MFPASKSQNKQSISFHMSEQVEAAGFLRSGMFALLWEIKMSANPQLMLEASGTQWGVKHNHSKACVGGAY